MATCETRHRYGQTGIKSLEEYKEVIDSQSHPHLVFEGVYTHFAMMNLATQWIINMNNLKP